MDLKEFIKETITSIAEATSELQAELDAIGIIINPPTKDGEPTFIEEDDRYHLAAEEV